MKKILISTVLLISIFAGLTFVSASAAENVSVETTSSGTQIVSEELRLTGNENCVVFLAPVGEDSPIRYEYDDAGFLQGVQGFYIDNGYCYLLSTSTNSIIQYESSRQCGQLCFDSYGFTAVYFAVSGDHIFVVDSKMYLHVFKNGTILDSYCLYDAFLTEAIEDTYCLNGKFYICINDFETMGFATYIFALADGEIVLEDETGSMLLEGQAYTQLTTETAGLDGTSAVTTIAASNTLISVPTVGQHLGLLYLGTNSSAESKVKTVEIIDFDEDSYYFKETIKVLYANGTVLKEIVIPQQKKPFVGNVKTISGTTYLLLAMEEYIMVVDVDCVDELSFPGNQPAYIERVENTVEPAENASINATSSRSAIISIAISYGGSFSWTCTEQNLLPLGSWTKPSYVILGTNYSMPYCWGGFDTQSSFQAGLNSGGRAGNACTTGVLNTYGLDCAGFVSRAWGSTTKFDTGSMHNIGTVINWSDIAQGDVLSLPNSSSQTGHCVLINYVNASGNYSGYECTTRDSYDRVIGFSRGASSFAGYTPYKCNGIAS